MTQRKPFDPASSIFTLPGKPRNVESSFPVAVKTWKWTQLSFSLALDGECNITSINLMGFWFEF